MKVFISWSGKRSEALAKALREWFPLVLHFVEPWLSQSDIQAGERWSVQVAKGLESCNFGVLCVTRDNLNSPWILFEAGALAKSMEDGRVIPLLLDLDLKEISGPLAQFQAKKAEISGIKELIFDLNKTGQTPVPDQQLEKLFSALWGDLEKQIADILKTGTSTKQTRPQGEILEELVSGIRSVEARFRDIIDDNLPIRKRRRGRYHPGMLMEFLHRTSGGARNPIHILVICSLLREDAPWVYEMANEVYKSIKSNKRQEARKIFGDMMESIEMMRRGMFPEELWIDQKMIDIIMYEGLVPFGEANFRVDSPEISAQEL